MDKSNPSPGERRFRGNPTIWPRIHALHGIFNHENPESFVLPTKSCASNAVIPCQSNNEEMRDCGIIEQFGQIQVGCQGRFVAKEVCKRRPHLNSLILTLLYYVIKPGSINLWDDFDPLGTLETMLWPDWNSDLLRSVVWIECSHIGLESFVVGGIVRRGKGYVTRWVEILSSNLKGERQGQEAVDEWGYVTSSLYCQRTVLRNCEKSPLLSPQKEM